MAMAMVTSAFKVLEGTEVTVTCKSYRGKPAAKVGPFVFCRVLSLVLSFLSFFLSFFLVFLSFLSFLLFWLSTDSSIGDLVND